VITLLISRDGEVEGEVPIVGSVRIGRDAQNDVVLDDSSKGVSRFHAEIQEANGVFSIVDLNSRNGTWIDGRRVPRATMAVGVPVMIGPYELRLEDRPSTEPLSASDMAMLQTVVVKEPRESSLPLPERPSRSGTRTAGVPAKSSRQAMLWLAAVVVLVAIAGIAFAVWRARERAVIQQQAVVVEPPPPVSPPPPPPAPDPEAETKQHLADARALIESDPQRALSEHIQPVLDKDPNNVEAADLKTQADAAIKKQLAQSAPPPVVPPNPLPKPVPKPIDSPDVAGIVRQPNEPDIAYLARGRRIHGDYEVAKNSLTRKDYNAAINGFRQVLRDQPGFQDAEARLNEAIAARQSDVKEALDNAAANERSGNRFAAMRWYQRAGSLEDSAETQAHIKRLQDAVTKEAYAAYDQGKVRQAFGDKARAMALFQNVVDWLPADDPIRKDAQARLEALKK
jgi:tetratricopeptide (TPR) repeat protein